MHMTSEQVATAFANRSVTFLAPELKPFKTVFDDAVAARDAALAASDCERCKDSVLMKFETWFVQAWRPAFIALLDQNPPVRSVFYNLLQVSEPCPA